MKQLSQPGGAHIALLMISSTDGHSFAEATCAKLHTVAIETLGTDPQDDV